jgi:hypothetical protein
LAAGYHIAAYEHLTGSGKHQLTCRSDTSYGIKMKFQLAGALALGEIPDTKYVAACSYHLNS